MANAGVVNVTEFDFESGTTYAKPKMNASGGKSVGILNSDTNTQLVLSTPLMLTWGVEEFVDDKTGRRSYDMALQFPNSEYSTPAAQKFLENMQAMETQIKADAVKNSKDWFNKQKMGAEVAEALFHPMLRYPKDRNTGEPDPEKAPTMKIKLNFWNDNFDNTEIYDMDQKLLFSPQLQEPGRGPRELIPKGSNIAIVMRCGGLWFANGKYGVTWRFVQGVVKPRASLAGRCLIQLDSNERSKLEAQADNDDEDTGPVVAVDSDEEDEDVKPSFAAAEAAAAAAAPVIPPATEAAAPKTVKRKVVRKVVAKQ